MVTLNEKAVSSNAVSAMTVINLFDTKSSLQGVK